MTYPGADIHTPQIKEAILRDGQSLRIRPIRPDDKKRLEVFFYALSPHTRYLRFMHAKDHISEDELRYFTELTAPDRFAYVATTGEGDNERIIAVGRWDMLPDGKSAEVAFTVLDNIQLRGVGTVLLEDLASEALAYDIIKFIARVLPENTAMQDVFDESGFKLAKRLVEGVYEYLIDLKDQVEYEKRQAYREHTARSAGVRKLLCPKRVAVIGASRDPESVGGALFRNILKGGFTGAVFPVNPKADSIAGVLAYPAVADCPGDIDLAVIVVSAPHVLDIVDQCAKKGVRGIVVISAGFSEAGEEGKERERLLKEKIVAYGMRAVGPNCLGILNNTAQTRLNATFSPASAPPGMLSIGSQSGALGIALLDYANSINLGVAGFVSFGNCADATSNDLLEFWDDDPDTSVIALYLESFGEPRKFGRTARRISHNKPIIAVKAGRSMVGARAASSHTGALAATDVAVDALFRQAGVIRVNTIQEMFNAAEVLAYQPLPGGPNVGILTNAGGPAVLASDACEGLGLKVPQLGAGTQAKLRAYLPKEAATANPVDMIASASPESFKKSLRIMLDDPGLDSIIVIYIPPLVTRPQDVSSAIKDVLARSQGGKPVLCCFMMGQKDLLELRKESGYAIRPFVFPEDAVRALAFSYEYSRYKTMEEGKVVHFPGMDVEGIKKRHLQITPPAGKKGMWLPNEAALSILKEYGIPVKDAAVAYTAKDAAQAAAGTGFPVVMKLRSSTITHKSDVGGVIKDIKSPDEAVNAFYAIKGRIEAAGRLDEMQGVVIQRMAGEGQELIIGMSQDAVFGPVVMIGFGGVLVELVKDVAFSIHPLRDIDPERMLGQLKSLPLLKGYRGRQVSDLGAIKETLLRFSAIIEDFPQIDQMEINPLIVFKEGEGCVAVDARIYVRTA